LQELKVSVPKIQQNYKITTMNTRIQGKPGSIAPAHAVKLKFGKNTLELLV